MLKFGEQQQQLSSAPTPAATTTFGASPAATSSIQYSTMMQLPQSSAVQQQQQHQSSLSYSTLQQQQQMQQLPLDGGGVNSSSSNSNPNTAAEQHQQQQQHLYAQHQQRKQQQQMHTSTSLHSTPDIVVSSAKDGAAAAANNIVPVIPDHIQQHVTNREALNTSSLTPLPSSSSSGSSSTSSSSNSASSSSSSSLSSVHTSPQHHQGFPTTSSSSSSSSSTATTTKHKRNNWKNKPKYCQHCNFYFELSQSHCPKCHKITQVKLKCPYCDDRWEYYTKMSTHLKNKHKNQQEPAPEKTAAVQSPAQTTSTAPTGAASASSSTTTSPQKDVSSQQLHDSERAMLPGSSEHPPDPQALSSAAIILQSALKQASLQQQHNEQLRQQQPAQVMPLQAPSLPIPPKIKISTARRNVHTRNTEPVFKEEQMQPVMLSPMSPIRKKRKTAVRSDTRHLTSHSDTGTSTQQPRYIEDASDTLLNFDEVLNDTSSSFDFPIFDSTPFLSPFNYMALATPPVPATSPAYSPTKSAFNYQQIAKKLFGPPTDEDITMKLNREYDTDSSSESHEDDTHGKDNRLSTSLFDLNLEDQDILAVLKPTNLFDRHDFDDDQSLRSRVIIAETPREEERWI